MQILTNIPLDRIILYLFLKSYSILAGVPYNKFNINKSFINYNIIRNIIYYSYFIFI
jgi:hypothetical protein